MNCCDPNGLNGLFRGPVVEAELRAFRKRGLGRRQRAMLAEVSAEVRDRSVLDIGCGIGALGLSLLERGAAHGTFVDVSRDYLRAARELAGERAVGERAAFVEGDFVRADLAPADLVLLDRVVCCYPDAPALLRKAAAHSQHDLVFSYPHPAWWMHLSKELLNAGMWLWRKGYRFHVHEREALLRAAESDGHTLQAESRVGVWGVAVFERR